MRLQKKIPILTAQIRALYAELDKKFRLNGTNIPIIFGFNKGLLGSYTQSGNIDAHWLELQTPYYKAGEALMKHNYDS